MGSMSTYPPLGIVTEWGNWMRENIGSRGHVLRGGKIGNWDLGYVAGDFSSFYSVLAWAELQ